MAIRLGTATPTKLYLGATEVTKAYLRASEAYSSAAAWTPSDLGASLALWLDADDASTITLNGSNVSQWDDKSGNARHAVQATAVSQPTYTINGLNGKPVLTFDGVDDLLETPSFIMGDAAVSVAQRSAINQPVIETSVSTNRGFWGSVYPGFTTHTNYGVNGQAPTSAPPNTAVTNPAIVSQTGLLRTSLNTLRIGLGSPAFAYLNGFLSEVIISSTALTSTDRQKLEGYLAWKWGLVANLPTDHPYKTTPPTA